MPAPFVFLSHSGADTEAARALKRRLEDAPDAKAAGLKVWFDKDSLRPGTSWSAQIAEAIQDHATAFVVYVGSGGVMNWVEAEVDLALSRATTSKPNPLLFIPVLDAKSQGSSALPPFAKRYQGVRDPLDDGEELGKLIKAILSLDWDRAPELIDEPFVGLRSMREEESDRFFGRDAEVSELVEKFRKHRIVAIVADSGTRKSSLAEAGFVPAFRGGALADPSRSEPDDRVWHVVSMRPGANPEEGLRTGISEAAKKLGRSVKDQSDLRGLVGAANPSETAFALQCDLPPKTTATLLIVDQFEEVRTQTPAALALHFVRLLLALADGDKDIRVLLTIRADHFNLVSALGGTGDRSAAIPGRRTLHERLTADNRDAILPLKRIPDAALRDVVCAPLKFAGDRDEAGQTALLKAVRQEISDRPSDLPLLQVALRAAWREHKAKDIGVLAAYHSVGGVLGALANEAEMARRKLSQQDSARLELIFVRLIWLGDTGDATRRIASLDEFDEERQRLLQRLADDAHARLVVLGEASAEITHEALARQWPWLQGALKDKARDIRRLHQLLAKSREWSESPEDDKAEYLASGAEKRIFENVERDHPDWLSDRDSDFLKSTGAVARARVASYKPNAGLLRLAWNEYRGWAALSGQMSFNSERWRLWGLILFACAGILGGVASIVPPEFGRFAAVVAALAAAVAAFLGRQFIGSDNEAALLRVRATAEGIHSECFRYAGGAYSGESDAAASAFDLRTGQIAEQAASMGLARIVDPAPAEDARVPPVPMTAEWYKAYRVENQIRYYGYVRARNTSTARRLRLISLFAFLAAVAFGSVASISQLSLAPWIGVMTTIGALVLVYSALGRFTDRILSVESLRNRMELSFLGDQAHTTSLADLVEKVEDLIQSEHDLYLE